VLYNGDTEAEAQKKGVRRKKRRWHARATHFCFCGCDLTLFESHPYAPHVSTAPLQPAGENGISRTNPSNKPSPFVAQLGTTYQILSLSCASLSFSVTSAGSIAPGISCLFANTSSSASFISRSKMMRCNSCLASSMRARSLESITKMRPWVPEK
jgi:hypothetical protein